MRDVIDRTGVQEIVTYKSTDEAFTFYYADTPPPEVVDENFAHWPESGTHLQYDISNDYIVLGRDGKRTGGRAFGMMQKKFWRYFVEHPNTPATGQDMKDRIPQFRVSSFTRVLKRMRTFIDTELDMPGNDLIPYEKPEDERYYFAKLQVDTAELIGIEPVGPVTMPEVSLIAKSYLSCLSQMTRLSKRVPDLEWPTSGDVASLANFKTWSDSEPLPTGIDTVVGSLHKIRDFTEREHVEMPIPLASDFVSFLRRLDATTFSLRGQQIRGLEVLEQLLWSTNRK